MPLITHIERNPDGKYSSIQQDLDGIDIPEGSTFVAFDSVKFAHATGQVALIQIKCQKVQEHGKVVCVDNRDDRWLLSSTIPDGKSVDLEFSGLGPAMVDALRDSGNQTPQSIADSLVVQQKVDVVSTYEYIGDGPLDLISDNRYDDSSLPAPFSDVVITPQGGIITALSASYDPTDLI